MHQLGRSLRHAAKPIVTFCYGHDFIHRRDVASGQARGSARYFFLGGLICVFCSVLFLGAPNPNNVMAKHKGTTVKKKHRKFFGVGEWAKSDQDYVTSAQYRYVVNGKEYEGHRVSPWVIVSSHNMRSVLKRQLNSVQLSSDGKVTVYYKPLRPEKSFLIKPGIKGQIFTAFLATIPFALYWVRYHG